MRRGLTPELVQQGEAPRFAVDALQLHRNGALHAQLCAGAARGGCACSGGVCRSRPEGKMDRGLRSSVCVDASLDICT